MRPVPGSDDSSRFNLSAATLRYPQVSLFFLLVDGSLSFLIQQLLRLAAS